MLKFIFIILISAGVLFAQNDAFNFTGNGARAAGMGYAFTGVADDATAISWNAGGLTQLYSPEASIIGRFGFSSVDLSGFSDLPTWDYSSPFQLNFVSLVFPFTVGELNVVGGIAYRTIYDFNYELKTSFPSNSVYPNGYNETSKSEGGVKSITPALGVQLNDMFSVGAAFNILTGSNKATYENSLGNSSESDKEDYSGLGVDIGVLVKPNSMLSLGANLNLPHNITAKSSGYKLKVDVPFFFSLGAAVHANDNLLLSFDYQSRMWSNSDIFAAASDAGIDVDLNSIHIGGEYLLNSGSTVIPIRIGFYTNPLLEWDDNQKQIKTNVITFGGGLILENIIIDGSWEIESKSYDTYMYDNFDNYVGPVKVDQTNSRVTIGATIHFGK